MRISDWSSDVCSSDLHRPRLFGRGDRLVEAGDTAIAALEDHALPHGIDPRHRRAALAPLLDREYHVLFRPQRSEEHMSELKLLMRISYAVFCFKKQKP